MTLTPEQIDSRMAELGGILWGNMPVLLDNARLREETRIQIDGMVSRTWERMKAVAEQSKKASGDGAKERPAAAEESHVEEDREPGD